MVIMRLKYRKASKVSRITPLDINVDFNAETGTIFVKNEGPPYKHATIIPQGQSPPT